MQRGVTAALPMLTDGVVRAITRDGAFRVVAVRTTDTVRGAMQAQNVRGASAQHFGELLTGAVIVREAMAPQLRLQCILKGASGRGSLVADSHPDGSTRGLVNFGTRKSELDLRDGALLQVMRTLPNGSLHQGVVQVPRTGGVSGALMAYLQDSEQVVSVIAVRSLLDDSGDLVAAGGYLVQLLPDVERAPLMIMTERLQGDVDLDALLRGEAGSAGGLVDEVLFGDALRSRGRVDDSFRVQVQRAAPAREPRDPAARRHRRDARRR